MRNVLGFFLVYFLNSTMIKWKFNFSPFGNISCVIPEATVYDCKREKLCYILQGLSGLTAKEKESEIIILKNKIQNLRCFLLKDKTNTFAF